jgi:SAM-dependent methyltransferase
VEQFKISDAGSYDAVAESFAHFTGIVTRPLAEKMVRLAGLRSSDRVLDVGTGSGIAALSAAGQIDNISVTGIDLSDGLLSIARRDASRARLAGRIEFAKADAEVLPFADRSFDAVISLFALMHFPNPERALAEMYRVLKPGGRLVIGIGSGPPWSSWQGWRHRLGRIRDLIHLKSGKLLLAPLHINQLVEKYIPQGPAQEETNLAKRPGARASGAASLIRGLGLTGLHTHWEGHHLDLADGQQFWELQSTFSSIARKRLEHAGEAQIGEIRQIFNDDCRRVLGRGGRLEYHYAAFYFYGKRPGDAKRH